MQLQPSSSNEPWVVTIAASAGGIEAIRTVLRMLPRDFPAAVIVVQHRTPNTAENNFRQILARAAAMPVVLAQDDQVVAPGCVYVARSDSHLTVSAEKRFLYVDGRRIKFLRSSANPLFESAAAAFENRLIAVVLTGGGSDATDGVQTVKAHGGLVIVQDPATALHVGMPTAAVQSGAADFVLPLEAIGPALDDLVHGRPISTASPAR
jgi:two-component system, chemotaxis family, protein-glutamate methylesterase/glutaminase